MKTWELNLVFEQETGMWWGFDFTITRPLISHSSKAVVKKYLLEWQSKIKKDYRRTPKIVEEQMTSFDNYYYKKQRYYNKLWKKQD